MSAREEKIKWMRKAWLEGASVRSLLDGLTGGPDKSDRVECVVLFMDAFLLSHRFAQRVGASVRFGDGAWSDEKLDQALRPLIEEHRAKWSVDIEGEPGR
jgi:hypothetical protein